MPTQSGTKRTSNAQRARCSIYSLLPKADWEIDSTLQGIALKGNRDELRIPCEHLPRGSELDNALNIR